MILFSILMIILATLMAIVILAVGLGGSMFILVFADVIVCIFLLVWIMRVIKRHKQKK